MSTSPEVIVHRDPELLATATAARLVISLLDAQATRGSASVVLTGGGIGVATLRAVRDSPLVETVDWSRVDVWWGDERFVPAGSADRNDRQARQALLDALPLDPARVFPMGSADAADGTGAATGTSAVTGTDAAESAATAYARLLAEYAPTGAAAAAGTVAVPSFDVLLLGVGPDGHVASLFPGSSAVHARTATVAVHHSPKPPPTRISLTLPTIQAAHEVWLLAAGEAKADAVARAFSGAAPADIPAVGARGRQRTLWLVDRAAAARPVSAGASPARRVSAG
ncbi:MULTISPECIES: 6-phosphogluconolactonase [Protofrankia]|uniref:6-phosphogluconolactonase n=1 Tax=Candidatus Protofrankia datiscae TaxID=2716812 RepID=F8B5I4_9ACTN|nr:MULTISPECIES: 6-phosphogluconolactonase [Protofrankia]AEH09154.1 6-phosphogluconolactonase [Candidatus Protofrankia datiscae]